MKKEENLKKAFKPYRSFINEVQLNEFTNLLVEEKIEFKIYDNKTIIDEIIVGSPLQPKFGVQLKLEDFKLVDELVLKNPISVEEIENHYLNQLDNTELCDILLNSKEWSIESVQTAEIILNSRNFKIPYDDIEKSKKENINNSRIGKKEPIYKILIYASFIVIGFVFHVIFIVAGLGMGYYYAFGKKYDKSGEKYFVYDGQTRFLGKLLFFGGIIVLIVELFFLIRNMMFFQL